MKRVAIVQSNYIPWKGYFDLIASVDEFVLYDQVQYTKNDWRNRNLIKTPTGLTWLTIPVGTSLDRAISEVYLPRNQWEKKHWKALEYNYSKSRYFRENADWISNLYLNNKLETLSELNKSFIIKICDFLGIKTTISDSTNFRTSGNRVEKLIEICRQTSADVYITGPSARKYLSEAMFQDSNIRLEYFSYDNYPNYEQLWGEFAHNVSTLDLIFNCGEDSPDFLSRKTYRKSNL